MEFDEIIGMRIKNRRQELGYTQEELARKLGYSGKSMVSMIEKGKRALNVSQIAPLAKALECSIDELLDGPESVDDALTEVLAQLTPEQKESALQFLRSFVANK